MIFTNFNIIIPFPILARFIAKGATVGRCCEELIAMSPVDHPPASNEWKYFWGSAGRTTHEVASDATSYGNSGDV